MGGIVFLKTKSLEIVRDFYISRTGMSIWLNQGKCVILRNGNLLLGLCQANEAETSGMITFFYQTKAEVNAMYEGFKESATHFPAVEDEFRIYQFFANDPEGRMLEFQTFLHALPSPLEEPVTGR
jgi:hypothetical protein